MDQAIPTPRMLIDQVRDAQVLARRDLAKFNATYRQFLTDAKGEQEPHAIAQREFRPYVQDWLRARETFMATEVILQAHRHGRGNKEQPLLFLQDLIDGAMQVKQHGYSIDYRQRINDARPLFEAAHRKLADTDKLAFTIITAERYMGGWNSKPSVNPQLPGQNNIGMDRRKMIGLGCSAMGGMFLGPRVANLMEPDKTSNRMERLIQVAIGGGGAATLHEGYELFKAHYTLPDEDFRRVVRAVGEIGQAYGLGVSLAAASAPSR